MNQPITLICTVRDEADTIAALLDSMLAQTRLPDEIIINDCQSRDATPQIVQSYAERHPRIRLVSGGHNISSGRNNAIAAASSNLIACTDAGLVLDKDWLRQIIAPLETDEADLVGGFFRPDPRTPFELALGATNYRNAGEIDPQRFLPFGKSMAFRKPLWEAVGGFPEWASHCEDILFALAAERAGFRRAFVPGALVYFRPRSSLRAFARQYFFYARGDGIAGLWPRRHLIRYATYGTALLLLWLAGQVPPLQGVVALLLVAGAAAYTHAPYQRLVPQSSHLPPAVRVYTLAMVPLIRLVGDCAKMVGYPVGLLRRRKH